MLRTCDPATNQGPTGAARKASVSRPTLGVAVESRSHALAADSAQQAAEEGKL